MFQTKVHRQARPYKQRLHLPDGVWTYKITSGWVFIREPGCLVTHQIEFGNFLKALPKYAGMSVIEFRERCLARQLWGIAPSNIKMFIEQKIGKSGTQFLSHCQKRRGKFKKTSRGENKHRLVSR